ncbi:hypothetical protein HQ563_02910 [bacterium]|nr:hypothetical protein [bacterium]
MLVIEPPPETPSKTPRSGGGRSRRQMHEVECVRMETGIPESIRELGHAASLAARVVNRFWLVLAVVSLVVVLPLTPDQAGMVELPLKLGKVPVTYFALVCAILLAATLVAFCAAYAHMIRVEVLVRGMLKSAPKEPKAAAISHPLDLFDISRVPTFGRVAPLAQLARGKHQFFSDKSNCPGWLRWITAVFYVALKCVAGVVYLGLPAYALWAAGARFATTPFPADLPGGSQFLVWVLLGTACVAIVEVLVAEVIHIGRSFLAIGKKAD